MNEYITLKTNVEAYRDKNGEYRVIDAIRGTNGMDLRQDPNDIHAGIIIDSENEMVEASVYYVHLTGSNGNLAVEESIDEIKDAYEQGKRLVVVQTRNGKPSQYQVTYVAFSDNEDNTQTIQMQWGVGSAAAQLEITEENGETSVSYRAVTVYDELANTTAGLKENQKPAVQERLGFVTITKEEFDLLTDFGENTIYLVMAGDGQ